MTDDDPPAGDTDLPGLRAPLVRPEFADPDLPGTAREVATAIGALIVEVQALNKRVRTNRIVMALLCLVLLALAVLGYRVYTREACQAEQNDAFREASGQLREAAAKERAAQRQLLEVSLNPASTVEDRRAATRAYVDGLIAADQQRAASPFPTSNCG